MTHRGADELSATIDDWLSRRDIGTGAGLGEVLDALVGELQPVPAAEARERVRRRLATVAPKPRAAQELLVERALEEIDRLLHRFRDDEYVPWSAVVASAMIAAGAIGLAVWLRRRERVPAHP